MIDCKMIKMHFVNSSIPPPPPTPAFECFKFQSKNDSFLSISKILKPYLDFYSAFQKGATKVARYNPHTKTGVCQIHLILEIIWC